MNAAARRLDEPATADPGDYIRVIEGGETAVHITLKDDKQWWLAHTPGESPPGRFNGPWLHWHTYPTGPWQLDFCTREVLRHNVDELYYVDYDGNEAHSVHAVEVVEIEAAPEFVREVVDDGE